MRSVMSSIQSDRVELDDYTASNVGVGKRSGGGLFGTDSVIDSNREAVQPSKVGSNQQNNRLESTNNNMDTSNTSFQSQQPNNPIPKPNEDLYKLRSTQYNHTNSIPTSTTLQYGSEVVLRFRNDNVMSSLSLIPQNLSGVGGVGGVVGSGSGLNGETSNSRNKPNNNNRICFMANEAHSQLSSYTNIDNLNRFTILKAASSSSTGGGGGAASQGGAAQGQGLGRLDEEMSQQDANMNNGQSEDDELKKVLCYGDKVILKNGLMKRVLGVQKEKISLPEGGQRGMDNGQEETYKLEVGCFRRETRFPTANTWTILRGGANANIVQLGSLDPAVAALEEEQQLLLQGQGKGRIPVYSGDPIVLKNEWTGGLLSLGNECQLLSPYTLSSSNGIMDEDVVSPGWSLNILTSTYEMNLTEMGGGASTENDLPLIEYLHQHNKCQPRKTETFQILAVDVPYCPSWVYNTCEVSNDRIFLGGSYLNNPTRHLVNDNDTEEEDELTNEIFPEMEGEERIKAVEVASDMPHLADLSVDVQERVLTDEIIGAMMGHEGQFIRYQLAQEEVVHDADVDMSMQQEDEEGGYHIVITDPGFTFASPSVLGGKLDSTLENLLLKLLPLCTNYAYVNQYVQTCLNQYECGVVARTLCEGINELLVEYLAFVSNLDYLSREGNHQMTMSNVHVHARPSIRTMAILSQVVSTVRGKKGGELLNVLYNLMTLNYSGDEKGNELCQYLLTRCAAPYANMLSSWLTRGKVHDPYGEFMIEVTSKTFRQNSVTSSVVKLQGMEWENWCCEKEEHVLFSLHDSNEDIIDMMGHNGESLGVDRSRATSNMSSLNKAHATGKYWRAIHCCHDGAGVTSSSPLITTRKKEAGDDGDDEQAAKVLLNPLKLSRSIDRSYHEASDTLLRMLLHDYDLLSSLRFMKKYFLLDQGDFFVDFLDRAEDELHKELPNVLQGRVQNWLSTSIARTSESSCQLASALRCTFQNKSLRDTLDDIGKRSRSKSASKKNTRQKVLSGFEAIAFEFKSVPFPTSIVLSTDQFRIYQLIFRLIFFAKYVERQLVSMWSDHQLLKGMNSLRSACSPTFSLRRRMLHFIQNLVYYLKFDVIEPNWRELESKLNATKEYCSQGSSEGNDTNPDNNGQAFPRTVDDVLHEHNTFLLRIANQCLLANYDLIERASKIMTTCLLFSTQIKRFMETTKVHELHEKTRYERSKLRYGTKKSKKDENREVEFRANRGERTQRCSDRIQRELCTETYRHMITRFDEVFSAHLAEFMKNLNSDYGQKRNAHLTNLSMQLDYNGFLSSSVPSSKE